VGAGLAVAGRRYRQGKLLLALPSGYALGPAKSGPPARLMHTEGAAMYDPFTESNPAVLVHEVDGPDFEAAWSRFDAEDAPPLCPVCRQGRTRERGTSPHKNRPWIRYSCGDVVAQEITAG
jgi:hypothetical protein